VTKFKKEKTLTKEPKVNEAKLSKFSGSQLEVERNAEEERVKNENLKILHATKLIEVYISRENLKSTKSQNDSTPQEITEEMDAKIDERREAREKKMLHIKSESEAEKVYRKEELETIKKLLDISNTSALVQYMYLKSLKSLLQSQNIVIDDPKALECEKKLEEQMENLLFPPSPSPPSPSPSTSTLPSPSPSSPPALP